MRRRWGTGTILILGLILGFVAGRITALFGEQCSSGSSHVDVILTYIRMHVWLRGPALQISGLCQHFGLPLQFTSDRELYALLGTGISLFAAVRGRHYSKRSGHFTHESISDSDDEVSAYLRCQSSCRALSQ